MGCTYATPRTVIVGRSLFIATASYESTKPGYTYSLALTTAELARQGIPFELAIMEGNCHVDDGRNSLVNRFLAGNCTDMIFIDADLTWDAADVIRMLVHSDDLVCGAYPKKCFPPSYPIGRILHTRNDGLLEVSYAPTGFMRIKRAVFEKLLPLQSKHGKENPTAVFFERRFNGPTRDGGDVTFCRKWIEAGGKTVVDPFFKFGHIGENRWQGKFIEYLANDENRVKHTTESKDPVRTTERDPVTLCSEKKQFTVPELIKRIQEGDESLEVFTELANAYGNKPWAATPEYLMTAYKMAKHIEKPNGIWECGSGLSTVVMAASGTPVIVYEEHQEWADRIYKILIDCRLFNVRMFVKPIIGKWFEFQNNIDQDTVGMLAIDGPRRRRGIDRMKPFEYVKKGIQFIVDDVTDVKNVSDQVRSANGNRSFVAGRV